MNFDTPIEKIKFEQFDFFVKRDDMIDEFFSGNKARKLHWFLTNDIKNINKIVSYGSSQSNLLYSLSKLAQNRNWKFDFYVDHIAKQIKLEPKGNYKGALEFKANIIEDINFPKEKYVAKKQELFIQEGGRDKRAQFGIKILSQELKNWIDKNGLKYNQTKIMLPSGTGTTALYLQKYLKDIEVLTCCCVGDENYLLKQFSMLEKDNKTYPTILPRAKKYHFGKLYKEFFEIYNKLLQETKIEFELLYDPIGWITILQYKKENPNTNIIYIHQGGLKGNETMIDRYVRYIKNRKSGFVL